MSQLEALLEFSNVRNGKSNTGNSTPTTEGRNGLSKLTRDSLFKVSRQVTGD